MRCISPANIRVKCISVSAVKILSVALNANSTSPPTLTSSSVGRASHRKTCWPLWRTDEWVHVCVVLPKLPQHIIYVLVLPLDLIWVSHMQGVNLQQGSLCLRLACIHLTSLCTLLSPRHFHWRVCSVLTFSSKSHVISQACIMNTHTCGPTHSLLYKWNILLAKTKCLKETQQCFR